MDDIDQMLLKVNSGGTLASSELLAVIKVLEDYKLKKDSPGFSWDEIYSFILLLNRANAIDHRQFVAKYIDSQDSFTVALVLETLCLKWGGTKDYLEQVISFALGVAWDLEDDARHMALKILGEYLREVTTLYGVHHLQILELLLNTFLDEGEDFWTRQVAYYALCRAAGWTWEKIPSECKKLNLSKSSSDIDWSMLNKLQLSVSSEGRLESGEG